MPLSADLSVKVTTSFTTTVATSLANGAATIDKTYRTILASGVAAGQGDKLWVAQRTIAPSANDDLDLVGATLTDAFGVALAFARIKGLIVSAAAANTNNVIIGGGASSPVTTFLSGTTPAIIVRPGATVALLAGQADATGYAVTATTADILRISNGAAGTSVLYDITIVGASA